MNHLMKHFDFSHRSTWQSFSYIAESPAVHLGLTQHTVGHSEAQHHIYLIPGQKNPSETIMQFCPKEEKRSRVIRYPTALTVELSTSRITKKA